MISITQQLEERFSILWPARNIVVPLAALFILGVSGAASGQARFQGQPRLPRRPAAVRPNAAANRAARAAQNAAVSSDPEAAALLRQMLRPMVEYSADEQTWIAQGGGTVSRQAIKGDTRGNVIRFYQSPPFLSGDIMLTGPNRYVYYRAATRTLTEVPPAGGQEDERDKNIVNGIKQRIFVARRTGNETVAGCNATIVLVSAADPRRQGYAKFWIDPVTHIRLKIEIANDANSKVSTSELSNLVTGPAANILPRDFRPVQFGAAASKAVTGQRVESIQKAMPLLPFHPLEPGSLPAGFRLDGIQVLTGPVRVGIFLRYTDGVGAFTITEHRVRPGQRRAAAKNNPDVPHWYVPMGDYDIDVVYRGHLPAQEEQKVHDSLQPVR